MGCVARHPADLRLPETVDALLLVAYPAYRRLPGALRGIRVSFHSLTDTPQPREQQPLLDRVVLRLVDDERPEAPPDRLQGVNPSGQVICHLPHGPVAEGIADHPPLDSILRDHLESGLDQRHRRIEVGIRPRMFEVERVQSLDHLRGVPASTDGRTAGEQQVFCQGSDIIVVVHPGSQFQFGEHILRPRMHQQQVLEQACIDIYGERGGGTGLVCRDGVREPDRTDCRISGEMRWLAGSIEEVGDDRTRAHPLAKERGEQPAGVIHRCIQPSGRRSLRAGITNRSEGWKTRGPTIPIRQPTAREHARIQILAA